MTTSKGRFSGVKWTLQIPSDFAKEAELALSLTNWTRQELLERALREFVTSNKAQWIDAARKKLEAATDD